MSRQNARLAKIVDMQCKQSDCILEKRDLEWLIHGLCSIDTSSYTMRKKLQIEDLKRYLRKITYSKT